MPSEKELIEIVKDESLSIIQRRDAIRHLAKLRGEPDFSVNQIPAEDLVQVLAGMTVWEKIGLKNLSLSDAAQAVAEGRMRRESGQRSRQF